MKLNQQEVQHLLLRCGFGDNYRAVTRYIGKTANEIFDDQVNRCQTPSRLAIDAEPVPMDSVIMMPKEEVAKVVKNSGKDLMDLNVLWIKEMVTTDSGLREKMAFFWHDHFACKVHDAKFMEHYLHQLRTGALGNFGDLLRAVSKSPAMLLFLNNQQNKKAAPNENFAREVMELFTLGRDQGYTEKDIKEAARAFTGWGFNRDGNFVERNWVHDDGNKLILGKTGNFTGDDVLTLLLEQKQTARYISQKLVRYFVSPNGNASLEKQVADAFYRSNYDILSGLRILFTSPAFYSTDTIACRIKSPIELIVTLQRQLPISIEDSQTLIFLQSNLGQVLLNPPNVAGWPDGKDWIDSSTLMFRLMLGKYIFNSVEIENQLGDSFDANDKFKLKGAVRKLKVRVNYPEVKNTFTTLSSSAIGNFMIQGSVDNQVDGSLIDQLVYFISKPEYQLC